MGNKTSRLNPVRFGIPLALLTGLMSTLMSTGAASAQASTTGRGSLNGLVGLSAERLLLADKVAAAKFGTGSPIEDPVREQVVLDQAAALAGEAGIDQDETVEFFRAQIEMSKVVQQELFDLWTAHPELTPTERPDLATEVRPELDRITTEFISQLALTQDLRGATPKCNLSLAFAQGASVREYDLDRRHARALHGAVKTVCSD